MKFKPFLLTLIITALFIAGIAALFSVTGIASLFSGHFLTIALMAGALELGKLVVASFLYRYWTSIGLFFKFYLVLAVLVLMIITSAGIFGYLSESYQQTKGDYSIVESKTKILETKKQTFIDRKTRLQNDKLLEFETKKSNQTRADSLTARGINISRTRNDIRESNNKITELETKISSAEDSIGVYDLKIIESSALNIKGELGPLKYIADAFSTDMDTVVKFFILILIFVFDPLAISLVIAANMVYGKNLGHSLPSIVTDEDKVETEAAISTLKKMKNFTTTELKNLKHKYDDFYHGESEDIVVELLDKKEPIKELPPKEVIKDEPTVSIKNKPKVNVWHSANWKKPK